MEEHARSTASVLRFVLNGRETEVEADDFETVAELLRDRLRLTGTKISCDEQICGVCTVLVDGLPVSSCTYLALELGGRSLTSIEGLRNEDGSLHPLQQAFIDEFAFQCGFCTPGMILSAAALLEQNPNADRAEICQFLDGNLCRCTGYASIVKAVQSAQQTMLRSPHD